MGNLYFDMVSGISGDMALAALLQKVPCFEELSSVVSSLFSVDIKISLSFDHVHGIKAAVLNLDIQKEPHIHRDFRYIRRKIENSSLDECVKEDAISIFKIIAEAEAKIHGSNIDEVHFHEVGGVDSIVDVVGCAYLINKIKPEKIYSSPARCGFGTVSTAHGFIPVPAPATLEILRGFPFERLDIKSELTTPTGAAIIRYYAKETTYSFRGEIRDIFYSAGSKRFVNHPNILRLIGFDVGISADNLYMFETNLDDISSEFLGGLFDTLFEKGALDVFYTPIFMKKNRPAYKLSILLDESRKDEIVHIVFRHTTTGGIRFYPLGRYELKKESFKIDYKGHEFRVKRITGGGVDRCLPEWEDIKLNAEKLQMPPLMLYLEILKLV
ncbi:MAG: nickel pincer cofactor biosynthesis protein LarC [Calditerrivibrio sp.]|nr:nickel pincer cofactor biosynthesis protein LarC [Calditerrivibrio sp.]